MATDVHTDEIAARAALQSADDEWHKALVTAYGRRAGDARYDPRKNGATPELARLRGIRDAAQQVWFAACDARLRALRSKDA